MRKKDVTEVMDRWRELVAQNIGISKEAAKACETKQLPFYVSAFVQNWGKKSAIGIIEQHFKIPHSGLYNGQLLGEDIFKPNMQFYQNQLFHEWAAGNNDNVKSNYL